MPKLYLSPSSQNNPCRMGDYEKHHCHEIAAAMEPLLRASDVEYRKRSMETDVPTGVKESNAYKPDFHFALHTNASNRLVRGVHVYYVSEAGRQRAATMLAHFCYPYDQVPGAQKHLIHAAKYMELNQVAAPSIIFEAAFHDNMDDAHWVHENIPAIARSLVQGICAVLGVPYVEPGAGGTIPPPPLATPTLRRGDRGEDVRHMQQRLLTHGQKLPIGGADGIFGAETDAAVRAFQAQKGLVVDGIVGPKTWEALSTPSPQNATLRRGDRGEDVRRMQQRLLVHGQKLPKGGADGIFGAETDKAVRAFQTQKGLVVDGVVGPKTWEALSR